MSNTMLVLSFLGIWLILFIAIGLTFVKTGSIAVVFRFSRFVRVMQPGLRFRIPIIESIERYSTQTHQHELPDEADNIDRVHDTADVGKKLPFRVLLSSKEEALFYKEKSPDRYTIDPADPRTRYDLVRMRDLDPEKIEALKEDSLHAPLTGEVAVVVEWYLMGSSELSILDFIQNVEPEGERTREEEVRKRIEDMSSRALQEFLGPVTFGHAREMMVLFSFLLKERLEILVGEKGDADKPWGIHIRDAYIKSLHPGRRVNEARADAAAAVSKKQEGLRDGEKDAAVKRMQADADEYYEEHKGIGEAKRIAEMARVMDNENARFVAALDVAETVLPKANTIIMPSDLGVIGGILSLGQNIAKNKKE